MTVAVPARPDMHIQIRDTLMLAGPVILTRIGQLAVQTVDTIMTGHYAASDLAYLGLGMPPIMAVFLVGMAVLQGASVLTAQAIGAGRPQDCGKVWQTSMAHGVLFGLALTALSFLGTDFLLLTGQEEDLALGAGEVVVSYGMGVAAVTMFIATSATLEGMQRPLPGLICMAFANVLNIILNYCFLNGWFGAEWQGADGVILATSISRWIATGALALYVLWALDTEKYGFNRIFGFVPGYSRKIYKIGVAPAIAQGLGAIGFVVESIWAGWLGANHIAAFQIAINLHAIFIMTAVGIGTAASVRVGNAVGRRDIPDQWRAGVIGLVMNLLVCITIALVLILWRDTLLGYYTEDSVVIAIAEGAVMVIGLIITIDGLNIVAFMCLRSLGSVWLPLLSNTMAYWVAGLPLAYYLAFGQGLGIAGILYGAGLAMMLAAVVNTVLFRIKSSHQGQLI